MIKDADESEDVAGPPPIAARVPLGKIITADGREHAVYQPIPGFEHLFVPLASREAHVTQPPALLHPHHRRPEESVCPPKAKRLPTPKTPKTLKRRRSVADESDDDDDDQTSLAASEESHTFYIGDFDKLKQFLRRRFDELTMKPLRGIITQWIKQLEPRRLGAYGRYHKKLPTEVADDMTPPWWPRNVHYNEPSHLAKTDLLTLAVDVMLLHRRIDQIKRKGSWIAKLRQVALYNIETTPSEHFSSSKGSNFSDLMRDRALKSILPSLFDVASSYEEHLAMYNLYEGAGGTDPGKGKYHTWQPISRPPRRSVQAKRRCTNRTTPTLRIESSVDASGDDTEPDDTMVNMSRRASSIRSRQTQDEVRTPPAPTNIAAPPPQQPWKVVSPAAVTEQPLSPPLPLPTLPPPPPTLPPQSQQDPHVSAPVLSPNSSFEDIKSSGHTVSSPHQSYPRPIMPPYNQPIQYSNSHPNYDSHLFQPISGTTTSFSHSAPGSFAQLPAPDFANSFQMSMFDGPYPTQVHQASFLPQVPTETSNHEYAYAYDGMFPHSTLEMAMVPTDMHPSFHGLPMNYNINGRESLHR